MRRTFRSALLSSLLVSSLLWLCSSALAQQNIDDDRAKAHFFAGESHFAAERWADAEREFALAYELSRRPEMLINLSRAHERNGQLAEAIADLELLVVKHPEHPYCAEARQRITDLRRELAARPPEPEPPPPPPPPAVVEVAPQAEPPPPPVVNEPLPPIAIEAEPPKHARSAPSVLTLSLGGTALAAGVVALATGLRARHLHNQLDDRCPGNVCEGAFESTRDRGQTLARTSTALTFVSVALAGGAAALWVYEAKRRDAPAAVAFGIDGTGARMRARF